MCTKNERLAASMSEDDSDLDLPAYLRRIEYAGERKASRAVLEALHQAHVTHIPFENLDILLGRSIALDLGTLQAKLVAGRRGGYCFEQNLLFAAVLRSFGFAVTQLAARVRLGADSLRPRTHMTLQVDVDGGRWLVDVGFGAAGPLLPVPHGAGEASRQNAWSFRIADEDGHSLLQSSHGSSWEDLYIFSQEPQHRVDYELACHYTSTHPASKFTQVATAQRIAPEVRFTLRDWDYSEDRGAEIMRRTLADDDEVLDVLADTFGLEFPAGTRFQRTFRR